MILLWVACDRLPVDLFEPEPEPEPVVVEEREDPLCEREPDAAPQTCVTDTLVCGDRIEGHSANGQSNWSNDFYRDKFCTPIHHDWVGPERVYRFHMDPMLVATVNLESPCEDLDLFAASWPHEGCPDLEYRVTACEADVHEGDGSFRLVTQTNPQTWLIAVDGKNGETGAFALSIQCQARGTDGGAAP